MDTPNKDRIIDIKWRGDTESNNDWRCALSRIQSSYSEEYPHSILDSSFFQKLDVDPRVCLLMSSPPKTMKTSNSIKQPVQELLKGNSNSTLGKIASATTMALDALNALTIDSGNGATASTWQPWMVGVKSWDGSKGGFSFEYEFSFAMGQYGLWNAEEEVVKPILNLIAPALPRSMNNFSMNGPFPTAIQLMSLLVKNLPSAFKTQDEGGNNTFQNPFSSMIDDLKSNVQEKGVLGAITTAVGGVVEGAVEGINGVLGDLSNALNTVIQESYKNYTYDISFGKFVTFNSMIITNGETSFSNEVDQYGYPIAGSVKLTFEGLMPLAMNYSDSKLVAIKYGGS